MTTDAFDRVMASLDVPMIVVTVVSGPERSGCLVGFHAQCSIDPRRYAVWISKRNHTCDVARVASHVAIHWLGEGDEDIARLFGTLTGDEVDKFALCDVDDGPEGVPLLRRLHTRVVARPVTLLEDDSDHICLIVEPIELEGPLAPAPDAAADLVPLRFSAVSDLEPGHSA